MQRELLALQIQDEEIDKHEEVVTSQQHISVPPIIQVKFCAVTSITQTVKGEICYVSNSSFCGA